ncbi:hypothetical protein HOLleu_31002 [Holothuria leucospilota]|uniref:EamA domain-containing protein n=1 Tax=Holothuria leucospilota TaxID=206669 RepID=A0A9Q1GXL3_HOLLE|nr:hypothetical protein HOLleu_31002 [Holothuria leucospilota]
MAVSEPLLEKYENKEKENDKKCNIMENISSICRNTGFIWCLLAGLGQTVQIVFLGEVANLVSPMAAMFIRSSFLFIFLFSVTWKLSKNYDWLDMLYNISFGFFDVLALSFSAVAMLLTPTSDVTSIIYNQPLPTSIMACIFLREVFDVIDCTLAVVNGIGLVLICQSSIDISETTTNGFSALGIILSIVSLVSNCVVTLTGRALAHRERGDPSLMLVMSGFNGVLLPSLYLTITSSWTFPETSRDQLICLLLGVVTAFGAYAYARALKSENALIIAVSLTLCIPLTYFYDIFFKGRIIVWQTIVGVLFTIGSTVCLYFKMYWFTI